MGRFCEGVRNENKNTEETGRQKQRMEHRVLLGSGGAVE